MESPARRGSAVGVDADDRVWVHRVGQRGALIDAGSDGAVVIARQLCANAHLVERTLDQARRRPN